MLLAIATISAAGSFSTNANRRASAQLLLSRRRPALFGSYHELEGCARIIEFTSRQQVFTKDIVCVAELASALWGV